MRLCRTRCLLWLILCVAAGGAVLSACGQKGNLYLPEEAETQEQEQEQEQEQK